MNDPIQQARDVALDILKPSERDLQHGLELHEHALVIESYGLGLRAPADAEAINAALDAGASDRELQDLTEDSTMTRWARDPELREEYQAAWEASGVTCTFQNAGEECNNPVRLLKRLARHTYVTDAMPEFLQRATTPEQIVAAHEAGKRCTYLTCNGVPLVGEQHTVEEELRYLRVFAELGVRMMHLTYNRRNPIGDGCSEPANAGLSDFGHHVVREMNRLGILIDLAHTGWQTTLDVARVTEQPVVISHAAAWALNEHVRCKSDEIIRAVLDTGGTMGITNMPAFLGGSGDVTAFLDHIDYVAKTFGPEAVTIGTDSAYRSKHTDDAERNLRPRPAQRTRWEALWPPRDPTHAAMWQQPRQVQSMAWTNWPLFTVGLVQRGHSDEDILKILGGNILRVARAAWADSAYATPTTPAGAAGSH